MEVVLLCGCSESPETNSIETSPPGQEAINTVARSHAELPGDYNSIGYKNKSLDSDDYPPRANEPSAVELLEALLSGAVPDGAMAGLGNEQIEKALTRLGYETLLAIRHSLESSNTLSRIGEGNTWEGSEEQLLLRVLLRLDLPETEAVALNWLMANPSPRAIAELGRYLGERSPGVHDAMIRTVAERSLKSTPILSEAPGELFQLLGEYGDAGTVSLLVDMPWHRDAYASVALALIPDGSGIDLLVQDARLFEQGQTTTHGRLAIELLAQRAHLDSEAAGTLLKLADQGLIPTELWPNLLATVAGNQTISLVYPESGLQSTHTIFRPEGNQVLYRVTNMNSAPEGDGIEDLRLAMLEVLLRSAPSLSGMNDSGSDG